MRMRIEAVSSLLALAAVVQARNLPVAVSPLSQVSIRLEGIREKCLYEELPKGTVLLVKHEATSWNMQNNAMVDAPLQVLTSVRDPNGHTVVRQQSKPSDRLFLTAATTGDHLVCFQAMLTQYSPNIIVKLGLEVFIGDAGDPHITSPVEFQVNNLGYHISKAMDQASELQKEQTLQRDREQHFRALSEKVNRNVLKWAFIQIVILALTAVYQVHSLRRFFRYKKLI